MTPCRVRIDYDGKDATGLVAGKILRITHPSGRELYVECFERAGEIGIAIGCTRGSITLFPEAPNRVRVI